MNRALIVTVRKFLEFNLTTIYRWAFLGEVIDAIEKRSNFKVDLFDGAVANVFLDDYIKLFKKKYDLVIFYCDPHNSKQVLDLANYCKAISPLTKTFVYGRACLFMPQYFKRYPFDGVHLSGDREIIISDYAKFLCGLIKQEELTGLWLQDENFIPKKGAIIENDNWFFPKLDKLPISDYKNIYKSKNRIFEYAISVSKGCDYNCLYCETILDQGAKDRRRNISEIIDWIESISDSDDFVVQLWSSNFFKDKNWVLKFCYEYKKRNCSFKWRAIGNIEDLDKEILNNIAVCNCAEIALGVETLYCSSDTLPKSTLTKFQDVIDTCNINKIHIKCLMMIGIPNQTLDDVYFSLNYLMERNLPVRYSGYTPLNNLKNLTIEELDSLDLEIMDRRTFFDPNNKISFDAFCKVLFQNLK